MWGLHKREVIRMNPKEKVITQNSIRHVTCIKPQREYSETKQNEDKYKTSVLLEYNY